MTYEGVTDDDTINVAPAPGEGVFLASKTGSAIHHLDAAGTPLPDLPATYSEPGPMLPTADGGLWEGYEGTSVKQIRPDGTVASTYPLNPSVRGDVDAMAYDASGGVWWTKHHRGIGYGDVDREGSIEHIVGNRVESIPLGDDIVAYDIAVGPDGLMYFAAGIGSFPQLGAIGRVNADASVTLATTGGFSLSGIAFAPDGQLWFVDANSSLLGHLDPRKALGTPPAVNAAPALTLCKVSRVGRCRTTITAKAVKLGLILDKKATLTVSVRKAPTRKAPKPRATRLVVGAAAKGTSIVTWNKKVRGKLLHGQYQLVVTARVGRKSTTRMILVRL